MNHAEAEIIYAFGTSFSVPAGLSDEERASWRHRKLLGYLIERLNDKKKPPHNVEITDLARDYDDHAGPW
jgi:hypothetical protein